MHDTKSVLFDEISSAGQTFQKANDLLFLSDVWCEAIRSKKMDMLGIKESQIGWLKQAVCGGTVMF